MAEAQIENDGTLVDIDQLDELAGGAPLVAIDDLHARVWPHV